MRGIGLVTGDAGTGKTCGARRVLAQLHSSLYRVVYVCLSTSNVLDLYKTISWEMGLPVERSRAALFRQIRGEVTRLVSEARCRPVLVIDEAHHLRPDVLEDLRLLTNYKMDAENTLCLLLLGQTELRGGGARASGGTCATRHPSGGRERGVTGRALGWRAPSDGRPRRGARQIL
jgi:type II secretory pathway predicted ATPase ExeA